MMTDWEELARKHEDSANHYARRCYDLEALNAELVEALEGMSNWFDSDGYATSVPPRVLVFSMRQALAKAKT